MTNETAGFDPVKKGVLICDTQPVAVEGLKWLIGSAGDLRFAGFVPALDDVYAVLNPEEAAAERAERKEAEEKAARERAETEMAAARAAAAEIEARAVSSEMPGLGALAAVVGFESPASTSELLDSVCSAAALARVTGASGAGHESGLATEVAVETETAVCVSEAAEEDSIGEGSIEEVSEPPQPAITGPIDAVVIDKAFGVPAVLEMLQKLTMTSHPTPVIIWGSGITEAEALRLLQAGARGIVRRTSNSEKLLACLRDVTAGRTWMEEGIFGSTDKYFNPRRSQLTTREKEVVVLVEKGMRNRDIAAKLGIQTGTVKIHLKHIFEKTGVRGRHGLVFTGLQNKGSISVTAPRQYSA